MPKPQYRLRVSIYPGGGLSQESPISIYADCGADFRIGFFSHDDRAVHFCCSKSAYLSKLQIALYLALHRLYLAYLLS